MTRHLNLSRALLATAVLGAAIGLVAPAAAQADSVTTSALGYDPAADAGSPSSVASVIGARAQWAAGNTGQGVDVAVIDTGVAKVAGLTNVINGPDLSFDSQNSGTRYTDLYGHGTHMASIIAGRDGSDAAKSTGFNGIAPGSRIVNVKVGASDGTVDVTQVVAAITWVTQHARDNGMNIRVINLSYGTNSAQSYLTDPLAYAAQIAWQAGILVVAAGGNDASARPTLADPALSPNLLAVGAEDTGGTASPADDTVPEFSQRAVGRHVDVVAPGVHLIGLRAPNSAVDARFPSSRVGSRFTRGSGTSQASAVVSGAAALLLAARPNLRPDQVKYLLTSTATPLPLETAQTSGAGLIDVDAAVKAAAPAVKTLTTKRRLGTGVGSVEAARGTTHVSLGGVPLTGEKDIFSQTWKPKPYAATTAALSSWKGAEYQGSVWTGAKFGTGGDWAPAAWAGNDWSGRSWVDNTWSGRSWVDSTWTGGNWTGGPWSSGSWS